MLRVKKNITLLSLLLVILFCFSSAKALPVGDYYDGWEPAGTFDVEQDGRSLVGRLDFAVYEDYPGNPLSGGQYVYAYQLFNYSESDVSIDSFSVGLSDNCSVVDIGYDSSEGGVEPAYSYLSPDMQDPQSALFVFFPSYLSGGSGVIKSGEQSAILLFSSDDTPTSGFGMIEGGSISVTQEVPSPTPEPATVLLLGLGGAFLTMSRKRRNS